MGQEALPSVSRFSAGEEASAAPHTAAGGHLASAQDPSLRGAGTQTCGGDWALAQVYATMSQTTDVESSCTTQGRASG